MNDNRSNKLPPVESDPVVSAEYRATATERTPPALDEMVLAKAKATTKTSGLQGFTAFWFRPLAFVASLGLALALVLELTSVQELTPVMDANFDPSRQETAPVRANRSNDSDGGARGFDFNSDSPVGKQETAGAPAPALVTSPKSELSSQLPQELMPSSSDDVGSRQASESVNAPLADESTSADFAELIEASSKRMQQQEGARKSTIQSLAQSRETEQLQAQVEEAGLFRASAVLFDETVRPCTKDQMAAPLTWWQCISELEEAGRHDEAKAELELFDTAHPDFDLPEILLSQ